MDVTPLIKSDQKVIQSYSQGRFRVSGEMYETPLLVFPHYVQEWKAAGSVDTLTKEDFQPLVDVADTIDVILFGSGKEMVFLPAALRSALGEEKLPVESMDTGAACRTYNVLMAEGRRVAAALLPV